MAICRHRGSQQFEASFDESILTNDGGFILIDLIIKKWNVTGTSGGFMFGRWHFIFTLLEKDMKKMRTKLLLGIPVHLTVPAEYSVW